LSSYQLSAVSLQPGTVVRRLPMVCESVTRKLAAG
jgi:hypothetical protein